MGARGPTCVGCLPPTCGLVPTDARRSFKWTGEFGRSAPGSSGSPAHHSWVLPSLPVLIGNVPTTLHTPRLSTNGNRWR
jgi:hypothetical protein